MNTQWSCPVCGEVKEEDISIYDESLKEQNFTIYPILPTCLRCFSKITFNKSQIRNDGRKMIALTGACASGKSTVAQVLMSRYGFGAIEGDCVKSIVRMKSGVKKIDFNAPEMIEEIENEIDILLALEKDIVISHMIIPDDLPLYRRIFRSKGLDYKFVVLRPDYQTLLTRSKTRTWYNRVTPEIWVRHFHDALSVLEQQNNNDVIVFDNSFFTSEESADRIMGLGLFGYYSGETLKEY